MKVPESPRVRIGISSCLLGEKVRFDGGHKKDAFLTSHFGRCKLNIEYLQDQIYLDPHPDELNLLNQL